MTAEHRVAMHRLAQERRGRGLPAWAFTVHGFRDALADRDAAGLIATRDRIVALLRGSRWFKAGTDDHADLVEVLEELADVGNPDIDWDGDYDAEAHLNAMLEQIYDLADAERVWLE